MRAKMAGVLLGAAMALTACADSESYSYGHDVMAVEARMLVRAWAAGGDGGQEANQEACSSAVNGAASMDTPRGAMIRGMDRDEVIDGCVDGLGG